MKIQWQRDFWLESRIDLRSQSWSHLQVLSFQKIIVKKPNWLLVDVIIGFLKLFLCSSLQRHYHFRQSSLILYILRLLQVAQKVITNTNDYFSFYFLIICVCAHFAKLETKLLFGSITIQAVLFILISGKYGFH